MSKEIKTKFDLIISSTRIGPKYDKNYHNRYYHERRRNKMGRTDDNGRTYSKRWITETYNLFDYTRHTKDFLEAKTLNTYYTDMNVIYDNNEIVDVLNEYTNKKQRLDAFDGTVFYNDEKEITYDLYDTLKALVLDD